MGSRNPERVRLSCENIMLQLLLLATNIKIVHSNNREKPHALRFCQEKIQNLGVLTAVSSANS